MEGPYRDLGSGFARLTGVEGVRRGPSRINHVEDALYEMLRNAWDAGAGNIYVSSSRRARRYRTLTVLDDGHGILEPYQDLVFEPGVTTRHLASPPASQPGTAPAAGSGVSLFHIKNLAVNAGVYAVKNPTSIQATFDTLTLPERAAQSNAHTSRSNLPGTIQTFISKRSPETATPPKIYYGSPAAILATLLQNRIIQPSSDGPLGLKEGGERLGLMVSLRTAQRIGRGQVAPARRVVVAEMRRQGGQGGCVEEEDRSGFGAEARLELEQEEISRIATILGEAARTRYLEVGEIEQESRAGEIVLRFRIYEPEEEYE